MLRVSGFSPSPDMAGSELEWEWEGELEVSTMERGTPTLTPRDMSYDSGTEDEEGIIDDWDGTGIGTEGSVACLASKCCCCWCWCWCCSNPYIGNVFCLCGGIDVAGTGDALYITRLW